MDIKPRTWITCSIRVPVYGLSLLTSLERKLYFPLDSEAFTRAILGAPLKLPLHTYETWRSFTTVFF